MHIDPCVEKKEKGSTYRQWFRRVCLRVALFAVLIDKLLYMAYMLNLTTRSCISTEQQPSTTLLLSRHAFTLLYQMFC